MGAGATRNNGLSQTSSDSKYVFFMDADDKAEPDMIERLHQKALADNADVVICAFYVHTDPNKPQDFEIKSIKESLLNAASIEDVRAHAIAVEPMPWCKLSKRSFLLEKGIYYPDVTVDQDFCWTLQLILNANKVSFLDEPLYHYLITPNSLSSGKHPFSIFEMVDYSTEYLKQQKFFDLLKDDLIDLSLDYYNHLLPRIAPEAKAKFIEQFKPMCQKLGFSADSNKLHMRYKLFRLVPKLSDEPFSLRARLKRDYYHYQKVQAVLANIKKEQEKL